MGRGLVTYRQKRDFSRTAEPEGGEPRASEQPSYVMHKHDASRPHFDLRLEQDGVLRSWALPKGPSLEPGEKRLAVEVEDHPLEYGEFEGVIPQEEYGGGTVMLWDHGYWELHGKPKADRLDFHLHGEKLTGHWTLVRMRDKPQGKGSKPPAKQPQWLMIRRSDDGKVPPPSDLSVKTGRSMAQIAKAEPATSKKPPSPQLPPQAREGAMPESLHPQLATLVDTPPKGKGWLHELKLDGYRLVAWLDQGRVTLRTRNGKDWTAKFQEVATALSELPTKQALIDGEVVAPEADGSTSFRKLQDYLSTKGQKATKPRLEYQAFDLLYLDGSDLRHSPLLDRKLALSQLIGVETKGLIRYCDHVVGQGDAFFEQVCQMGLEGMVSKKASARYQGGRQQSWLKTKCSLQDEFIIVGYTPPSGSRKGFGSLLLASVDGGDLVYAGRVGTGFNSRQLVDLHQRLQPLEIERSPFPTKVPDEREVQWVRPELVADVEFTERTRAGALRHPVFRGVREDKGITELAMSKGSGPKSISSGVAGVAITHPDRELYPEHGITKLDIANYYADVHEWLLPHLVERPLALLRCPEGLEGECFFQKHADPHFAEKVPRVSVPEKQGGKTEFVYVKTVTDLVWLVQFGVLELHPWASGIADLEAPDNLVFDLDPGPGVAWPAIARAALELRERLESHGLNPFLQATGGKGLHLVVPIRPTLNWEQLKGFAKAISQAHAKDNPKALTTNMAKSKRRGKIFIDYLRNGRGNTSIGRYSTRARANATVATPLRWEELHPEAPSNRYSVKNIRRRLSALREDPWSDYENARREIGKQLLEKFKVEEE